MGEVDAFFGELVGRKKSLIINFIGLWVFRVLFLFKRERIGVEGNKIGFKLEE